MGIASKPLLSLTLLGAKMQISNIDRGIPLWNTFLRLINETVNKPPWSWYRELPHVAATAASRGSTRNFQVY